MSEELTKFIGVFWVSGFDGWMEIKRIIVSDSRENARKKALLMEERAKGNAKFVGFQDEIEQEA